VINPIKEDTYRSQIVAIGYHQKSVLPSLMLSATESARVAQKLQTWLK